MNTKNITQGSHSNLVYWAHDHHTNFRHDPAKAIGVFNESVISAVDEKLKSFLASGLRPSVVKKDAAYFISLDGKLIGERVAAKFKEGVVVTETYVTPVEAMEEMGHKEPLTESQIKVQMYANIAKSHHEYHNGHEGRSEPDAGYMPKFTSDSQKTRYLNQQRQQAIYDQVSKNVSNGDSEAMYQSMRDSNSRYCPELQMNNRNALVVTTAVM